MDILNDLVNDERLWYEVFNKLTNPDIGGKIPRIELLGWADEDGRKAIMNELFDGTYEWSIPKITPIQKPGVTKIRQVYVYKPKDRLIQGVLSRYLSRLFDDLLSDRCCAYRKGYNTVNVVKGIVSNDYKDRCIVKIDISKYFDSVSKNVLFEQIQKFQDILTSKGYTNVDELFKNIKNLYNDDRVIDLDGELLEKYKSLAQGLSLSNLFANHVISDLDFGIMEKYPTIEYFRYSDDILIIGDSQEQLHDIIENYMTPVLNSKGLSINPKKIQYYNPKEKVSFLGIKFYYDDIQCKTILDIDESTVNNMKRFIRQLVNKSFDRRIKHNINPEDEVRKIISKYNEITYKCYVLNRSKYGWAYYAFRCVNVIDSLKQLDFYLKDMLRYVYTGKHNKQSINKLPNDKLRRLGYISLVDMFNIFCDDVDLYKDMVYTSTVQHRDIKELLGGVL